MVSHSRLVSSPACSFSWMGMLKSCGGRSSGGHRGGGSNHGCGGGAYLAIEVDALDGAHHSSRAAAKHLVHAALLDGALQLEHGEGALGHAELAPLARQVQH